MRILAHISTFAAGLVVAIGLLHVPAFGQQYQYDNDAQCGATGIPPYTSWQTAWNQDRYDPYHVVLGTVGGFTPYRLTVVSANGDSQVIDLKPGTAIFPTGQTPAAGEHVAVVGYWSQGTFIANRVILRP
jgi:hypothetical protein